METIDLAPKADKVPFDLNNAGDAHKRDPYPVYRWLRDQAPLYRNPDGSYIVSRFEDVAHALQTSDMTTDKSRELRAVMGDGSILEFHLNAMVTWDPPRHTAIRRRLAHAFTPRAMARWEPMAHEVVDALLQPLRSTGRMDLVQDFAAALPLRIICRMLGVPTSEHTRFRAWAESITTTLDPGVGRDIVDIANRHSEEWKSFFRDLIALRQKEPGDDLISMLIANKEEDEPFEEEAILHNLALLLSAGHETTTALITNAVDLCFANPEQLALLRDEPAHFATAVEEFLRFESPVQLGARRTTRPVTFSGGVVPAHSLVWTVQGAANRDERKFTNPDTLDVTRAHNRQLAFATGIHVCLGAPLARLEARIALERLLCDFPTLRRNGEAERQLRTRYRGFRSYPVAV